MYIKLFQNIFTSSEEMLFLSVTACPISLGESEAKDKKNPSPQDLNILILLCFMLTTELCCMLDSILEHRSNIPKWPEVGLK